MERTSTDMGLGESAEPVDESALALSDEDRRLLSELGMTVEELQQFLAENEINPELPEPAVPSIYLDCWHPYIMIGHSDRPQKTWVISLPRARYKSLAEAQPVINEKLERLGLRVHGEPFWDFRTWCWRVWRPH